MSEKVLEDAAIEADVFERNLDAFREHAPRMHAVLKGIERTYSRLEVGPDGALDVSLEGKKLYGRDAVAYTQEQLESYFAAPLRQFLGIPKLDLIPGLAGDYCSAAIGAMADAGIAVDAERQSDDAFFTIVFGVGLGMHIQPLAEKTGCRCVILVEPIIENIYHSLSVIDWREIFVPSDGSKRSVHFVTESDQEIIASALRSIIREKGASLLDGMYAYTHYPLSTLARAHELFYRDIHLHLVGLGFFEDEIVMTANSVGNLVRGDVQVICNPVPVHDTPVILCGSGPSIDSKFDEIRRLQKHAIIVSLGSNLRSLLSHGIRPDFHVEMENEIDNADNICKTDDEFGVQGITLLASSTVQPYGAERFDDIVLYFRDRVTSSHLFAQGVDWLGSCGPTVTNAGLIVLLYLGFRNFHFFGIDMGSRDIDRYHAADTFIGMGQAREWGGKLRVPVVANFGGTAYAEGVLRWSRLAIETVIRLHKDVRAINCSDGARIAGATPMLPHILDLGTDRVDRDALRRMLGQYLPVFGAQRRRAVWDRALEERHLADTMGRIEAVLDRAEAAAEIDIGWLNDIYDIVLYDTGSPAAPAFLYGSLTLIIGAVWWYDRRIADPVQRQTFRRIAIEQQRVSLERVRRRMGKLFDDIEDVFAGRLESVGVDTIVPPSVTFVGEVAEPA